MVVWDEDAFVDGIPDHLNLLCGSFVFGSASCGIVLGKLRLLCLYKAVKAHQDLTVPKSIEVRRHAVDG
jgi:hypothetical protein